VTVPGSLFGDEHAAAEGPLGRMTVPGVCRNVSCDISGLRSGPSLLNTLQSREVLRELQFVLAAQCDRARGRPLLFFLS